MLPGHGGLLGLFDQAAETDFGGAQEFRISALHERRQEDVEGPIHSGASQDAICHRIDGCVIGFFLLVGVGEELFEGAGMFKQPGWRNTKGRRNGLKCFDRGVELLGFDVFEE